MPFYFFVWDDETMEHLAEHGVSPDDFQDIVCDPIRVEISRTSGRPIAFGMAGDGRTLACIYEHLDRDTILPITAFEPGKE